MAADYVFLIFVYNNSNFKIIVKKNTLLTLVFTLVTVLTLK